MFFCRMDPLLNFLQLKTCLLSVKFFATYYLRNQNLKETNQSPVLGSCCNLVKVGSISSWSRNIVGKIMAVEPSCTPQFPQLKNIKKIYYASRSTRCIWANQNNSQTQIKHNQTHLRRIPFLNRDAYHFSRLIGRYDFPSIIIAHRKGMSVAARWQSIFCHFNTPESLAVKKRMDHVRSHR